MPPSVATILVLLLSCFQSILVQDVESDRLVAELQLDDLELIDACENLAVARKTAFLNQDFHNKTVQEQHYGLLLRAHYDVLREFTDVPYELERNWTYQVKPGGVLLPQETWDKFVIYENHVEELLSQSKLFCQNQTQKCVMGQSGYENVLNKERKFDTLKSTWESWQSIYNSSYIEGFKSQIWRLKEAATLNEFETVREYWETLSDFQGAYEQAGIFWEEISPFYKKLQTFVRERIFKYYNIEMDEEEIPIFLLGGNLGTDWSNIADIVLPHPQLHYDIETYLKYKDVEEIYHYSENIAKSVGLGPLGNKFWETSKFNSSVCSPQKFEFCRQEYTELVECNNTSWPVYLNAHETAMKIALNNLDYASLPRQQLRYCAIDDAVEKLGSLLAIESLEYHGILEPDSTKKNDSDSAQMTKLLLTALRVMPGLSYSLMADKWRMDVIEHNSSDLVESWWKFRQEYTGAKGVTNKEHEYIQDSKIISNKPHISTFFGTLIAFQLLSYYKERGDGPQNILKDFREDDTFMTVIKSRHSMDWPYLLSIHYGLDLSTTEILKYFEPLERYFEMAPSEQVPVVTSTTTTTTMATTTATEAPPTSTLNPILAEVVNDQPNLNISENLGVLNNKKVEESTNNNLAMYVGVGGLVVVGSMLVVAFGYKKLRRKPRTNNRRFVS